MHFPKRGCALYIINNNGLSESGRTMLVLLDLESVLNAKVGCKPLKAMNESLVPTLTKASTSTQELE